MDIGKIVSYSGRSRLLLLCHTLQGRAAWTQMESALDACTPAARSCQRHVMALHSFGLCSLGRARPYCGDLSARLQQAVLASGIQLGRQRGRLLRGQQEGVLPRCTPVSKGITSKSQPQHALLGALNLVCYTCLGSVLRCCRQLTHDAFHASR